MLARRWGRSAVPRWARQVAHSVLLAAVRSRGRRAGAAAAKEGVQAGSRRPAACRTTARSASKAATWRPRAVRQRTGRGRSPGRWPSFGPRRHVAAVRGQAAGPPSAEAIAAANAAGVPVPTTNAQATIAAANRLGIPISSAVATGNPAVQRVEGTMGGMGPFGGPAPSRDQ